MPFDASPTLSRPARLISGDEAYRQDSGFAAEVAGFLDACKGHPVLEEAFAVSIAEREAR